MNKQQYKAAHRLARLFRYEDQLKSVFHYPIGFDCPCHSENDVCEFCIDDAEGRRASAEALQLVRTEIKQMLLLTSGVNVPLVATTLKSNYHIFQKGIELGEFFQRMIKPAVESGNARAIQNSKKILLSWWLDNVKSGQYAKPILERDQRDLQSALAAHTAE